MRFLIAVLILVAPMLAQSPPPACPASRPVDDLIAGLHKHESKKRNRNANPVPDNICVFGWCKQTGKTPPTFPEPMPSGETPAPRDSSEPGQSSSKPAADKCNEAMEQALGAAHSVDVGDYYFEQKNYRAALFRYQDAARQKPQDAAIHVRLGRALEKLNQFPQAIAQYKTAEQLATPEKWVQEARSALARMQKP